jgi:hypothetical protein
MVHASKTTLTTNPPVRSKRLNLMWNEKVIIQSKKLPWRKSPRRHGEFPSTRLATRRVTYCQRCFKQSIFWVTIKRIYLRYREFLLLLSIQVYNYVYFGCPVGTKWNANRANCCNKPHIIWLLAVTVEWVAFDEYYCKTSEHWSIECSTGKCKWNSVPLVASHVTFITMGLNMYSFPFLDGLVLWRFILPN